jgi:hypothetical protein
MLRMYCEMNQPLPVGTLLLDTAALLLAERDWRSVMTQLTMKSALLLLVVLAAGCTTMGTGFGTTAIGTIPVNFSWKSTDGVSGTMNATVSDGTTYAGQFFQITTNTTADNLGPLWDGWGPGLRRGGWAYWGAGPEFTTHYTGKVVANLVASNETHMRCTFQLVHPSEGMAGGGAGECQTPSGKTIDATFPHAS